ncbi:MAG: 4Fe-4S binding protein, partial [Deltaproteobacteria bacterium]|nr:4Fe-4S binding protein [Deltaproteobacteria bacterium]
MPLSPFAGGGTVNGRRTFLRGFVSVLLSGGAIGGILKILPAKADAREAPPKGQKWYGFGVSVDKCIGCARCMEACKNENNVPREPFFFRTWVERYITRKNGETTVKSIGPNEDPSPETASDKSILRSFFVPKLCNQCASPACVQVCPVGATFQTKDGVVLVNEKTCIGCRYCIQACPYGARYLHP